MERGGLSIEKVHVATIQLLLKSPNSDQEPLSCYPPQTRIPGSYPPPLTRTTVGPAASIHTS